MGKGPAEQVWRPRVRFLEPALKKKKKMLDTCSEEVEMGGGRVFRLAG